MGATARLGRRRFLHASAATAGATILVPSTAVRRARGTPAPRFVHGVASGDPLPGGVVLWTRVTATAEAAPGSGAGPEVDVTWEVARDPAMTDVVASGLRTTGPGSPWSRTSSPGRSRSSSGGRSVDGVPVNPDAWDGYTADRHELIDHIVRQRSPNTVFLTGDIHSSWACDVPRDAATYPASGASRRSSSRPR